MVVDGVKMTTIDEYAGGENRLATSGMWAW